MIYRTFGRTGWSVSEIAYGMWGLAGWTGSDETESQAALETPGPTTIAGTAPWTT